MSSQPTTPVRVPKAVKTYSPATQDPDLRSQINTVLLRDGHIEKIQQTLHHTLSAHPSNWPSKISARTIELLRSGEYNTFPALIEKVMEEVRHDTEQARLLETPGGGAPVPISLGTAGLEDDAAAMGPSASELVSLSGSSAARANMNVNGAAGGKKSAAAVNGAVNGVVATTVGKANLAVPKSVIEEGIKVTRECLEMVCEIDE